MPLPADETVVATAKDVLGLFKGAFGEHPGLRPAHAKGLLLAGTFTPTAEAKSLSAAPHFNAESTPVTARLSDSTGIPAIPDNDPNASPRGLAVRFNLPPGENGRRQHTDIVSHSTPFFPARTGAEFGEFLRAAGGSPAGTPSPTPIEKFLGSHPGALAFVTAPKPIPVSFANEGFFALNAFKFINAEGKETYIRYSWVPEAGLSHLSDEEAKSKSASFLFDDVKEKISSGGTISYKLLAQIAEPGDPTNDITLHWPEERKKVELGTIKLDSLSEDDATKQKTTIFDPIPRLAGIEPSDDPLLDFRAALYLVSGRERRAA